MSWTPRALLLAALPLCLSVPAGAQVPDDREPIPQRRSLDVSRTRGFAAAWIGALEGWGWSVESAPDSARATGPDGTAVTVRAGTPFVRRGDDVFQLADEPYRLGEALFVPLQLFEELALGIEPRGSGLAYTPGAPRGQGGSGDSPGPLPDTPPAGADLSSWEDGAERDESMAAQSRTVIIDAGHGGRDLGALGYGGTQEKDVALAVALALARALADWPEYRVQLLRDVDDFVPLWERGGLATELKGEGPGVFLSIHANSHPTSREAQGFETFFLAETRTDHERRILALENQSTEDPEAGMAPDESAPDLGVILGELRNADFQRWSAHLAGLVQEQLAAVHPGPNRGVSQAPLAAITTSLMPSVLIELGFVTNAEEETLLNEVDFQEDVAEALARAVDAFFQGYPPRTSRTQTGSRR